MEATEAIILYSPTDMTILAEVFEGENYFIPENIEVYIGTLEDFLIENPEYNDSEESLNEKEYFTNYEEIN